MEDLVLLISPKYIKLIVLEDLQYLWGFMLVQDLGYIKIIEVIINCV